MEEEIKRAIKAIISGEVIAYPTETVYGLGADAFSDDAVRRVYEIKRRVLSAPISLAVSSFEMLEGVASIGDKEEIIRELLPGPVTVLLRRKKNVPDIITAGGELVGIRFPENEIARRIIDGVGVPITSTSANISGEEPPTNVGDIKRDIKEKVSIVVRGECKYGEPSTVVDISSDEIKIRRKGAGYGRVLHVMRDKTR